jgi:outer membrane protein W
MKKSLIILGIFSIISCSLQAQKKYWHTKNILSVNWEIATPLNKDYLTRTSFAGANFDFKHFVSDKFSLGMGLHFNTFEQYQSARVIEKPDGSSAVFTDFVPQVYVLPLLLKGHYYFTTSKNIMPYAGLGVGAQFSQQRVFYNIFVSREDNWGFAARPELGLMYQFENATGGLNFNMGYNFATNKNPDFRIENLQHLGFSIGGWWNLYN